MLIDTHAHLTDPKLAGDLGAILERAKNAGVDRIVSLAGNLEDGQKVVRLINEHVSVYGCIGIYPGETHDQKNWQEDLGVIEELAKSNSKIVGIGEIGLDFYWTEKDKEREIKVFRAQLQMATRINKPVVIHNRQQHSLIREVVESLGDRLQGVFHCFSGDRVFLQWVIERGFYVGVGGNVTYPSNRELRDIVSQIPDNRLVVETDSPYLPPQGKRGERNEPANVKITAELIARVKGITLEELAQQTSQNAKELFGI